jgi:hypothetical protein
MRRRASGATGGGANRLLASIRRTGIPVGVLVAGATLAAACGPRAEETEEAPAPDTAAEAASATRSSSWTPSRCPRALRRVRTAAGT